MQELWLLWESVKMDWIKQNSSNKIENNDGDDDVMNSGWSGVTIPTGVEDFLEETAQLACLCEPETRCQ